MPYNILITEKQNKSPNEIVYVKASGIFQKLMYRHINEANWYLESLIVTLLILI